MCGFAGFIDPRYKNSNTKLRAIVKAMNCAITPRGPDSSGEWVDAPSGVALGHRRLSILDLSPAGHQPMVSACGRYVIIFNGEVYNHNAIRTELKASGVICSWRGHSDTEVILEAISHWGLEASLQRFNGMFAFALWNTHEKTLSLARDRMGEKPLCYGWVNGLFFFSSTLDACRAHPDFTAEIDIHSQALFLRYGKVPAPHTLYRGMMKLLPAQTLTLTQADLQHQLLPVAHYYWDPRQAVEQALSNPFCGGEQDAIRALDCLLKDAVALRMQADVPLGAFLSGGYDSSAVVALMQSQSSRKVRTFTIGFNDSKFNEAEHAKAVARYLGTDHTEMTISAHDALNVIPLLPSLYDEPFADSSALPTYLVSKLTRKHVTVALSGDGGDELFGGYGNYGRGSALWRIFGGKSKYLLNVASAALCSSPPALMNKIGGLFGWNNLGDRLGKLADVLPYMASQSQAYNGMMSHWSDMQSLMPDAREPITLVTGLETLPPGLHDMAPTMQYLDMRSYLPDDILVKVDRASMGVSLESRIPLLDHRIVEFAWSLPLHFKRRSGTGKWILKELVYQYLPKSIMARPKQGFAVPLAQWLRTDLRDWAENLLQRDKLKRLGINDHLVRKAWMGHLSGQRDFKSRLWTVLMLLAFVEKHNR